MVSTWPRFCRRWYLHGIKAFRTQPIFTLFCNIIPRPLKEMHKNLRLWAAFLHIWGVQELLEGLPCCTNWSWCTPCNQIQWASRNILHHWHAKKTNLLHISYEHDLCFTNLKTKKRPEVIHDNLLQFAFQFYFNSMIVTGPSQETSLRPSVDLRRKALLKQRSVQKWIVLILKGEWRHGSMA